METASSRQDASIDLESLDRVCRYVDELFTKRTLEALSDDYSDDDVISLESIDLETAKSMKKFIRVLAKDDARLAYEFEDVVLRQQGSSSYMTRPNIRQETLSSISEYLNLLSKARTRGLHADSVDEDDSSTLPGTVILENEHPDMLKSISNYIDYTMENKALSPQFQPCRLKQYSFVGSSLENKTTVDSGNDTNQSASRSIHEFLQNLNTPVISGNITEMPDMVDDTESVTSSDNLTMKISPETLSQIGAFIDLIATRNKKINPSHKTNDKIHESEYNHDNHLTDDDISNVLSEDRSTGKDRIISKLSDDSSLVLNENPELLASVQAYIDKFAKGNLEPAIIPSAKLEPDTSETLENQLEQLDLNKGINVHSSPIGIGSQTPQVTGKRSDSFEQNQTTVHLQIEQHRPIMQHPLRCASSDPPANLISVRSEDETETHSVNTRSRSRRDPESSREYLFDTTGEQIRLDDNRSNINENSSRSRRDPELSKTPDSTTCNEPAGSNYGESTVDDTHSGSCQVSELSKYSIIDKTGEQSSTHDIAREVKGCSSRLRPDPERWSKPVIDTTRCENKSRGGMGGPELLLAASRSTKNKKITFSEDKDFQSSTMEIPNAITKSVEESCPALDLSHSQDESRVQILHTENPLQTIINDKPEQIKNDQDTNWLTSFPENAKPVLEKPHDLVHAKDNTESGELIGKDALFSRDIKTLTRMVTGIKRPSTNDEEILKRFLYFCFPLVGAKEPSAPSVSKIMCKAGELGLPLDAADRFLSLAQMVLDEHQQNIEIEAAPSDEVRSPQLISPVGLVSCPSEDFEAFVSRLVDVGTKNPEFVLPMEGENPEYDSSDDQAYVDIRVSSGNGGDDEADAIEVDLLCGALLSNSDRNGYDHWQTIAAKLLMSNSMDDLDDISSTSSDAIDRPPSQELVDRICSPIVGESVHHHNNYVTNVSVVELMKPNHPMKVINESLSGQTEDTYDHHVMEFWKEQQKIRRKPFGYPGRTVRSLADSYSQDDNDAVSFITASHASSYDMIEDAWVFRRSMAMYGKSPKINWKKQRKVLIPDVQPPKPINAVHATARFFHRGSFLKRSKIDLLTKVWKETYVDRTAAHSGYLEVHVNSLYSATSCFGNRDPRDSLPWETRPTKQRFLHEQSVSFCKNWFGVLVPMKRNQIVDQPICRPESFPMPVAAGEWTEDWYQRKVLQPIQSNLSGPESPAFIDDPIDIFPEEEFDDESFFDKAPQCGRIRNMKQKIGEKITRVTPDLTSSLRRSRWRKRHFPRGTFPYK